MNTPAALDDYLLDLLGDAAAPAASRSVPPVVAVVTADAVAPDADAAAKEAALVAAKRSNTGRGCMDEKPIPAAPSTITFVAPTGSSYGKATAYSPEWTEPRVLETKQAEAGLEIKVPEYLVYCVIRLGAGK